MKTMRTIIVLVAAVLLLVIGVQSYAQRTTVTEPTTESDSAAARPGHPHRSQEVVFGKIVCFFAVEGSERTGGGDATSLFLEGTPVAQGIGFGEFPINHRE